MIQSFTTTNLLVCNPKNITSSNHWKFTITFASAAVKQICYVFLRFAAAANRNYQNTRRHISRPPNQNKNNIYSYKGITQLTTAYIESSSRRRRRRPRRRSNAVKWWFVNRHHISLCGITTPSIETANAKFKTPLCGISIFRFRSFHCFDTPFSMFGIHERQPRE